MSTNDWNASIIEEFRANEGAVGGMFAGAPMLLLKTTGAKSGLERTNPLVYMADGNRYIIFASKAGADTNPDWYHNVVAHPRVTIEVGTDEFGVDATVVNGTERDELYDRHSARFPTFAEYQAGTDRRIPVIALTRA